MGKFVYMYELMGGNAENMTRRRTVDACARGVGERRVEGGGADGGQDCWDSVEPETADRAGPTTRSG